MRGHVDGLASPHDLGPTLPALYLDDLFAQRFISAFDDVLAPIYSSLDCLPAYLDPWLAPEDFVDWLSVWVGAVIDGTWDTERRRASVAHAAELYRLARHLARARGADRADHRRRGGDRRERRIGLELQSGRADARLAGAVALVRVTVDDPSSVDIGRLDLLVAEAKPAHVPRHHRVEWRARRDRDGRTRPGTTRGGPGQDPRAASRR